MSFMCIMLFCKKKSVNDKYFIHKSFYINKVCKYFLRFKLINNPQLERLRHPVPQSEDLMRRLGRGHSFSLRTFSRDSILLFSIWW